MGRILLCADTESLIRPSLIGLEGANLDGLLWLDAVSDARQAREQAAGSRDIDEVWVVATDEVEGVNLAAAIRADNPELPLHFIAFEPSGSVLSRAREAGVTCVLGASQFMEKFYSEARRRSLMDEAATLDMDCVLAAEVQECECLPVVQSRAVTYGPECADAATQPSEGSADPSAFVVSMMSGSGGVGKSAVCALAASLTSGRGFKTCVLDCDLQFGDMHHIFKGSDCISVDDVLSDPASIRELASRTSPGKVAVVSSPSRLESSEALFQHVSEILDACSTSFDAVFVNTGSTWAESHAQLLERSSCSIFLLDQRASSIRACQHALELCMRLGIATGPFVYALNRCERGSLFSSVDIANIMQGAHVFELKEGGHEVEELLGAGLADELASIRNDFCASIDEMLDEILPSGASLLPGSAGADGGASIEGRPSGFVMPESRMKRRGRGRRAERRCKGKHENSSQAAEGAASLPSEIVISSDLMVQP